MRKYTALRYSKITIFASACRFWIQALRKTCAALITALALIFQPVAGLADESARNVREFGSAVDADADWLGAGGDPSKMTYAELGRGSAVARLKDIATIQGVRENQLVGYGLVIGLKGTGDSLRNSPFTEQSMRAMLDNLGISAPRNSTRSKNTAAVIVTANLPAFAGAGSRIDVTVSSLGDATSLQGGTLVMTQLMGADNQIYAVAQGNMIVSGFSAEGEAASVTQGVPTSGRIPNGALVEREVAGSFGKDREMIVELRDPDFTTAVRAADTINVFAKRRYGRGVAIARDAKTIRLSRPKNVPAARFLAELEGLPITTDEVARVVVDERTGTVVIGEKVRISKVAISHGSLTVRVTETPMVVQPEPFSDGETAYEPNTDIAVNQQNAKIGILTGANLENLVKGLNQIGVKPTGIIAILQAIKTSGALHAELVVQ
ncbi:flagellar basal body P-ring protein FlgI [Brucella sp. 10RB9213]|uniref:flagellar basal body P-ring protein FlgI n=1 Tax=Brucella sp. 10RB9213 TaxID=1844039 RepID=UPI001FFFBE07|nr:flagellar basal body P-ring protein FlgI [Brucella sp. 10RB9213]